MAKTPETKTDLTTPGTTPENAPVTDTAPNTPQAAEQKHELQVAKSEAPSHDVPTTDQPSALQTDLDKIAGGVASNPPVEGTVTLDFGKAGKLTGCLIMSNSSALDGDNQTVVVPFGETGAAIIHGVPSAAIVK